MAAHRRYPISAGLRALVPSSFGSVFLERARMASRDGPLKCAIPTLQQSDRRQARTVATTEAGAFCCRRDHFIGKCAGWDAAPTGDLFSSNLNRVTNAEHIRRRANGNARLRGAAGL